MLAVPMLAGAALSGGPDPMTERKKRRRPGVRTRAEYEANGITKARPWEREGMSRTDYYRKRMQIDWWRRQADFWRAKAE